MQAQHPPVSKQMATKFSYYSKRVISGGPNITRDAGVRANIRNYNKMQRSKDEVKTRNCPKNALASTLHRQ
eukprot:6189314-Pleurochrysis_carterae.AAC.4